MTPFHSTLSDALTGRYAISRELGAGGMAIVYLARDLKHERDVALKVLRPDVSHALARERFHREIRLAARLTHPHILPLHDSGHAEGWLYFVMPVMQGDTVRDLLATAEPLEVDLALRIASEVAEALDHAHRHQVVHRDIKPENILLHEGHAIVADFGIGKAIAASTSLAAAASTSAEGAVLSLSGTQPGVVVGTPAYMSPEQITGEETDGRSDLYSLGCVLFEMLTGSHPFGGSNVQQMLARRFTEDAPSVTVLRPDVPPNVAQVLAAMLARDPAARPATGAEVAGALRTREWRAMPHPAGEKSVAVLPFENLSTDADNEYFSDGITDDIIVALARIGGLKVAARSSSFTFKGQGTPLPAIAQSLGVRTVLHGSVRKVANRVRVTAQLMQVDNETQIWSERYDRELTDIFAIQDDIVHAIVAQLEVRLGLRAGTALVQPPTADMEAYQLYLRGREIVLQRGFGAIQQGIDYFAQALGRDPALIPAYAGLAEAYAALGLYQYMPPLEARRLALEALASADRVAPDQPVTLAARFTVRLFLNGDAWRDGAALEEALRHAPNNSQLHAFAGIFYAMRDERGRRDHHLARARELDPLSPFILAQIGLALLCNHQFDEAYPIYQRTLELDPAHLVAHWQLNMLLSFNGEPQVAVQRMRRIVEVAQRAPILLAFFGLMLARAGEMEEARAVREELRQRGSTGYVGPSCLLIVDLGLGDEAEIAAGVRRYLESNLGAAPLAWMRGATDALRGHPTLGPLVESLPLYQFERAGAAGR